MNQDPAEVTPRVIRSAVSRVLRTKRRDTGRGRGGPSYHDGLFLSKTQLARDVEWTPRHHQSPHIESMNTDYPARGPTSHAKKLVDPDREEGPRNLSPSGQSPGVFQMLERRGSLCTEAAKFGDVLRKSKMAAIREPNCACLVLGRVRCGPPAMRGAAAGDHPLQTNDKSSPTTST